MATTEATAPDHVVEAADTLRRAADQLADDLAKVAGTADEIRSALDDLLAWRSADDWEAKLADLGLADVWDTLDATADEIAREALSWS